MNIEFVRTFLKVVDSGSFIEVARSLHLTQAAISRRIRSLEEYLGCDLFVRNKAGAYLTPSGRQFLRYAINLVQTLERARHDVGTASFFKGSLTIGGRFGLWDGFLLDWLDLMSNDHDIQIRAEIGLEEDLMQNLIDGRLDIGIMYTPQNRPTLRVERLLEEELILVTTTKKESELLNPSNYVHVDWGPEFFSELTVKLPELSNPRITVEISWIGLQRILTTGGSGYFPRRLVLGLIKQGLLFEVLEAPSFQLPAYVVYAKSPNNPLVDLAVIQLQQIVNTINLH